MIPWYLSSSVLMAARARERPDSNCARTASSAAVPGGVGLAAASAARSDRASSSIRLDR